MAYSRYMKPAYEPGEVILNSSKPYSFIIVSGAKGRYCDNCSEAIPAGRLTRCGGCGWDCYCGPECRQAAWAAHSFECPLLDAWKKRGKSEEQLLDRTRFLFRTLVRRHFENKARDSVSGSAVAVENGFADLDNPPWRQSFDELLSHSEDIGPEIYTPVLQNLDDFCNGTEELRFEMPPRDETIAVFGRVRTNCLEIFDWQLNIIGFAVYISISVVNHSCVANSNLVSYGLNVHWRALRKIDVTKEELTFNYDLREGLDTIAERKEFFTSGYFFECGCKLCDGSKAAKDRDCRLTSMRCVYGDECSTKTDCDYCLSREDVSVAERQGAENEVASILAALDEYEAKENHLLTIEAATRYLRENTALGVCNVGMIKVREKLVNACYLLEDCWKTGVEAGLVLLDVNLLFLTHPSPAVGKLRFTLGVMMARGGQWTAARKQFAEAHAIMSVTHGAEHKYVMEIDRWHATAVENEGTGPA